MTKEIINEKRREFLGTSAIVLSGAVLGGSGMASPDTISPRPLLVIAGSKADTLFWSQEVHKKAKAPKELFVVDGATHIDLYDRPQFVTPAVAKLTAFFSQHLSTAGGSR